MEWIRALEIKCTKLLFTLCFLLVDHYKTKGGEILQKRDKRKTGNIKKNEEKYYEKEMKEKLNKKQEKYYEKDIKRRRQGI